MKQSLYVLSLLILLLIAFFGGARFNQRGAVHNPASTLDRQILHYVDPMNPAHTSKEPGIAPCGMPMEPVYADEETIGYPGTSATTTPSTSLGAVKINLHKQQIIGVQIGEVAKSAAISSIRALGRIIPDENRVYTLIAATDGWMEEIKESTTGGLVNENQLLAQIKVYNYDFFTWQQRYLTELGHSNRIGMSPSPLLETDNSRRRMTSGAGYEAGLPIPESEFRMIRRAAVISQMAAENQQPLMTESIPSGNAEPMASSHSAEQASSSSQQLTDKISTAKEQLIAQPGEDHSAHTDKPQEEVEDRTRSRNNNQLYSNRGRLELLNFGVEESQLKVLAASGGYITHIDVRSPVNGLVLSRNVSPHQKIERGTECFKVADLSKVWIEADIYDNEAKHLQAGIKARISAPRQGESFTAEVTEVLPRFDATSRTLKVRLELDNAEYWFRPDMFVDVEFQIPLPESISVPSGAVIDSGKRKTVYVVMGEGVFEPREVATGWQTSERVEITNGLQPGEKIVVSGNFLIDSESRMKLAAARLMEDKTEQSASLLVPASAAAPAPQSIKPATGTQATTANKVKDPVCGMTVNQGQAAANGLTVEMESTTYSFCSADCKEQFVQDPQRFLTEKAHNPMHSDAPAHGGHPHD